jgi:hypothetical protein
MRNQPLTLSLFMLGVFTDDHDFAIAFDDLTLLAHGLNGRSYFHTNHPFSGGEIRAYHRPPVI